MRSLALPILSSSALALIAAAASAAAAPAFGGRGTAVGGMGGPTRTFGVPRGGGLFGGKKEDGADAVADASSSSSSSSSGDRTVYPPMSRDEIEDWLGHIPVFAVTDSKGSGVVLRPDNDTSVFYFFMSPQMANATLQTLRASNEDMDLQISAFSLGKIWFRMLEGESSEVKLRSPGSEEEGETAKGVQYRLVPDTRDLMGARMLLTMDPEDGERLKGGGEFSVEDAQRAVQKAMTESPKFKSNYNEVPVFMIQQMRLQKQTASEGGGDGSEGAGAGAGEAAEPINMLPMYFSLQNMVGTWQQFLGQAPDDVKDVEPAINLMELHELIALMQEESEIDFRNTLLIPPVPMSPGGAEATRATTEEEQIAQMGGDTLGDL